MSTLINTYKNLPRMVFWINRLTNANYEEDMEVLPELCDTAKTSIDVGAKVGMYTYRLLKYSGKVIAFEPIPELFSLLTKVFANNQNARIINEALSHAPGRAKIRTPIYRMGFPKYGQATIEAENKLSFPNVQEVKEYDIKMQTLDTYRDETIGFIKIDVEGHELSVLRGGKKLLEQQKPTVLVEIQDILVKDGIRKVTEFMANLGYEGCFLSGHKFRKVNGFSFDDYPDVKNFIFIHKSRKINLQKLQARLKA